MPSVPSSVMRDVHSCRATAPTELAAVTTRHYAKKDFSRFSPFAEEGFTCLDHSMMSKKKHYAKKDVKFELGNCLGYTTKFKVQGVIGTCDRDVIELVRELTEISSESLLSKGLEHELYKLRSDDDHKITAHMLYDHMSGKTANNDVKCWMQCMPNSFSSDQKWAMAIKVAGVQPDFKKIKAHVKPNEILGKIKPRLIQHLQQEGAAHEGPAVTALSALYMADETYLETSIKHGSFD